MIFIERFYRFFLLRKQLPHVTLRHSFVTLSPLLDKMPQTVKNALLRYILSNLCFFSFFIFYLQRFFPCMTSALTPSIFTFQTAKGMIVITAAYANYYPFPPAALVRIVFNF